MTSIDLFVPSPGTEPETLLDGDRESGLEDGLDGEAFVEMADNPP